MALNKQTTLKSGATGNYWKIRDTPGLINEKGQMVIIYDLFKNKSFADTQKDPDPSVHAMAMDTKRLDPFFKEDGPPPVKWTKAEVIGGDPYALGYAQLKLRDAFLADAADVME